MPRRKSALAYYRALGLSPGASSKEVRVAYLRLVKQCHPDRFAQNSRAQAQAQERLKDINEAYAFLKDYRPGQLEEQYWQSWEERNGATAQWREYQRWTGYRPPTADPYAGDYQYRPVGENKKSSAVMAILLVMFLSNAFRAAWYSGSSDLQSTSLAEASRAHVAPPAPPELFPRAAVDPVLVYAVRERPAIQIGSDKLDVVRVQGTPDRSTETEWRYGDARVSFRNATVSGWRNGKRVHLKTRPTLLIHQ
jgi:hypothetical protein